MSPAKAKKAKRGPARYIGLGVTAGLLAAFFLLRGPSTRDAGATLGPQKRGGQIVGSIRSTPRSFNRLLAADAASDLFSVLTQGRLVRVNRSSFDLEPWLAEKWESSSDGRTHTVHLRQGVTWSDGTPFTSADVLFSLRAAYDEKSHSVIGTSLRVANAPITATAPDANTVVFTYPAASGPGMRLLEMLPILPKHKLGAALDAGTFAKTWDTSTAPPEI